VQCYCGEETREVACGWNRKEEKICSKLNDEGVAESWTGRFCCGKACEGLYDCGIHPCENVSTPPSCLKNRMAYSQTCHPHPIRPLVCPMSPDKITDCACGQTPLSLLSAAPRQDCTAPIPTCGNRCPKSRPCGHQCTRTCHAGECPPCHEEVVRHCRCGESVMIVGCDEIRGKKERGEDVVCERICKALRK